MLKDITIGQFFPGRSLLHKMDPRGKILFTILFIVILFLVRNYCSLLIMFGFTALCVLISGIPLKTIWKSIRALIFIVLFTAVLQIVYNKDGDILWKPFPQFDFAITAGGVGSAVFLVIRIISLVVISSLLTYTSSPTMLTDAIERLLSPLKLFHVKVHSLAMMMTIALRFIPTLIEELEIIMNAQRSRGAKLDAGKIPERAKALVTVFVPLFISAFRRAADLAVAMECRCYTDGVKRSRLKIMRFGWRDLIGLTAVLAVSVSALFLSFYPFSGFMFERII